jgi:hypothetical protein
MMNSLSRWLTLFAVGSLLNACGGGSSSPATVAATTTFSVDAAYKNNVSTARNSTMTITAVQGTQTAKGTATMVESALSATTFNGRSAQTRTVSVNGSVSAGTQTAPFVLNETTYVDSTFVPVGNVTTSGGTSATAYQTSTVIGALPTAAKVGDSGSFLTVETFTTAAKTVKTSTGTITWALSADTATTALLKMTTTLTGSANNGTTIETLRITSAGAVTRLQVDANLGGVRVIYDFP